MKRKRMKKLHIVPKLVLETLTTNRLLGYLKRLQMCHDTKPVDHEVHSPLLHNEEVTKDTCEWKESYNNVKDILAKREHKEKNCV